MHKISTLAFALLCAVPAARAGDVDDKERTARTACLSGDFAKGVALLSELFVDSKNPTFIYNQGRCFEQSRRYEDAIGRFQEYLRAGRNLTDEEKADANQHIADCQALLDKQLGRQAVVPMPVETDVSGAPPPAHPPVESGRGLRIAGIAVAATGGAALVTGLVLNLKVNSMASDMEKFDSYTRGKESDRKTYQTLGWVGYGVGATCVATGAILYVLGLRSGSPAPTVSLAPGQAAVAWQGVF
jgi:hypothetical protein